MVGLSPWVEYEFRVVAGNSIGIGEPSKASELLRTKASGKKLMSYSTCKILYGIGLKKKKVRSIFVGLVGFGAPNQRDKTSSFHFHIFYIHKARSIFSEI